jgi:hypothetical protein
LDIVTEVMKVTSILSTLPNPLKPYVSFYARLHLFQSKGIIIQDSRTNYLQPSGQDSADGGVHQTPGRGAPHEDGRAR